MRFYNSFLSLGTKANESSRALILIIDTLKKSQVEVI